MQSLSLFLYQLLLPLVWILVHTIGLIPRRIRANVLVRRGLLKRTAAAIAQLPEPRVRRVWIHCASMGEFEAIRPLARKLRARGEQVLLTFYSTSGPTTLLRSGQSVDEADWIGYLPFDLPWTARAFVRTLAAELMIVTKHDLWYNHLRQAHKAGCRVAFINANFHPDSHFAKPLLRAFNRATLANCDRIASVSEAMAERFRDLLDGLDVPVCAPGETRFDRVVERARNSEACAQLPAGFSDDHFVWVMGSSWAPEEELVLPLFAQLFERHPKLRLLLVPHEPDEKHLAASDTLLKSLGLRYKRLSHCAGEWDQGDSVLLVDRMGLLAGLYACASLAIVGGGFTTGVHSVIEPAAFSLPVLFGPKCQVAQEAQDLLVCGGGALLGGSEESGALLASLVEDAKRREEMATAAAALVRSRMGATDALLRLLD